MAQIDYIQVTVEPHDTSGDDLQFEVRVFVGGLDKCPIVSVQQVPRDDFLPRFDQMLWLAAGEITNLASQTDVDGAATD